MSNSPHHSPIFRGYGPNGRSFLARRPAGREVKGGCCHQWTRAWSCWRRWSLRHFWMDGGIHMVGLFQGKSHLEMDDLGVCMVYLPTFGWFLGEIQANIPWSSWVMEHLRFWNMLKRFVLRGSHMFKAAKHKCICFNWRCHSICVPFRAWKQVWQICRVGKSSHDHQLYQPHSFSKVWWMRSTNFSAPRARGNWAICWPGPPGPAPECRMGALRAKRPTFKNTWNDWAHQATSILFGNGLKNSNNWQYQTFSWNPIWQSLVNL